MTEGMSLRSGMKGDYLRETQLVEVLSPTCTYSLTRWYHGFTQKVLYATRAAIYCIDASQGSDTRWNAMELRLPFKLSGTILAIDSLPIPAVQSPLAAKQHNPALFAPMFAFTVYSDGATSSKAKEGHRDVRGDARGVSHSTQKERHGGSAGTHPDVNQPSSSKRNIGNTTSTLHIFGAHSRQTTSLQNVLRDHQVLQLDFVPFALTHVSFPPVTRPSEGTSCQDSFHQVGSQKNSRDFMRAFLLSGSDNRVHSYLYDGHDKCFVESMGVFPEFDRLGSVAMSLDIRIFLPDRRVAVVGCQDGSVQVSVVLVDQTETIAVHASSSSHSDVSTSPSPSPLDGDETASPTSGDVCSETTIGSSTVSEHDKKQQRPYIIALYRTMLDGPVSAVSMFFTGGSSPSSSSSSSSASSSTSESWIGVSDHPAYRRLQGASSSGLIQDTQLCPASVSPWGLGGREMHVLACSAVGYSITYRAVNCLAFTCPVLIPRSNEFDSVTCCKVADVDWDGEDEIVLGTYGTSLLVYKYSVPESTGSGVTPGPIRFEHVLERQFRNPLHCLDFLDVNRCGVEDIIVVTQYGLHALQPNVELIRERCLSALQLLRDVSYLEAGVEQQRYRGNELRKAIDRHSTHRGMAEERGTDDEEEEEDS
eukprot:TRINITY_DN561_c0_g1_i1.p1 TRINITY_DN561_c0_g1~~TRINITY_DN561_c0_g1_i1.p1  ORF type:complete len:647 (-),score=103.98 TRINITY_DN561_c0_g1_i1:10-1950(-)